MKVETSQTVDKKYDVAFCAGVFDMLHQGHIELLKIMKDKADVVVIFLHDCKSTFENKGKFPVQDFEHRQRNLFESGLVDRIEKVEDKDPGEKFATAIRKWEENYFKMVYVRGDDWLDFPGKDVIEGSRIDLVYKKYTPDVSSTQLRDEAINR